MAWIRDVQPEEVEDPEEREELQALYDQTRDAVSGRTDNILSVHSLHPKGMAAHWTLYRAVMAGTRTLRGADREMVALLVSRLNECHY